MDIRLAMMLSIVGFVQVMNDSHQLHPRDIMKGHEETVRNVAETACFWHYSNTSGSGEDSP